MKYIYKLEFPEGHIYPATSENVRLAKQDITEFLTAFLESQELGATFGRMKWTPATFTIARNGLRSIIIDQVRVEDSSSWQKKGICTHIFQELTLRPECERIGVRKVTSDGLARILKKCKFCQASQEANPDWIWPNGETWCGAPLPNGT